MTTSGSSRIITLLLLCGLALFLSSYQLNPSLNKFHPNDVIFGNGVQFPASTPKNHSFGVYVLGDPNISSGTNIWNSAIHLSSIDKNQAKASLQRNQVILSSNIKVMDDSLVPSNQLKEYVQRDAYSYQDLARTLSHLQAIKKAYDAGNDYALFFEEGQSSIVVDKSFERDWEAYARMAPKDWRMLQWGTSSSVVTAHGLNLKDPWISWMPDHTGVFAYSITREGMEVILNETYSTNVGWDMDKHKMLLADELLYFLAGHAYTSAYPWVHLQTTMDEIRTKGVQLLPAPALSLPAVEKSILSFRTIRISSFETLEDEVHRIRHDAEMLCSIHRNTRCDWILYMVLKEPQYLGHLEQKRSELPSYIRIETIVTPEFFNKFTLFKQYATKMGEYDLVVFSDNDQRIAGFPWATFVEKKGTAILAGPARQVKAATLKSTMFVQGMFNRAVHFKKPKTRWSRLLYEQAKGIEVPFLEVHFILMDGDFATWFWPQIMSSGFEDQYACWGLDSVWCGAGKSFRPDREGCMFVPVVSEHEDTKQIGRRGRYDSNAAQAMKILYNNETIGPWKNDFAPITDRHEKIAAACSKLLQPNEDFSIMECLARARSSSYNVTY